MIAYLVERAGGVQPVACCLELRVPGYFTYAQSGNSENLFGGVELVCPLHSSSRWAKAILERAPPSPGWAPQRVPYERDASEPDSAEAARSNASANLNSFIQSREERISNGPGARSGAPRASRA